METRLNPLEAYRRREGLDQSELAKRLKKPQPTVSKWCRGRRRIDVDNLPLVVKVTGIPARLLRPDLAALFLPEWMLRRDRRMREALRDRAA